MTSIADERLLEDIHQTVKDAGATQVPPWLAVVAALCSAQPKSMDDTFRWLAEHRADIEATYTRGRTEPLNIAALQSDLMYEQELGGLDRSIEDHWLRGRRIFGELLGHRSFMQIAALSIAGLDISARDAEMLEQFAIACLTVDRKAWPMAATRRVAGHGGGVAAAVVAGAAMMGAPMLAGLAAADCARFLRRAALAEQEGVDVSESVRLVIARKERVMGFGRPVVGPDERSPVLREILRRFDRADGAHVALLARAEQAFFEARGLKTTAAAWAAAVLTDLGASPEAVHALSNHWVTLCVFAQASFSDAQWQSAREASAR